MLGKQNSNVSAVCALALYQRGSQPSLEFILSWPIVNNNPATASFFHCKLRVDEWPG